MDSKTQKYARDLLRYDLSTLPPRFSEVFIEMYSKFNHGVTVNNLIDRLPSSAILKASKQLEHIMDERAKKKKEKSNGK